MKKLTLMLACTAVALLLSPGLALAQSNAEPSLHVSLHPCQIFSGSLAADSTFGLDIRGNCNVPETATAVEVAITVSAESAGSLKLWEYDMTVPAASVMSYPSGTASSFGVPRLCAPVGECFYDVSARSTSAVTLTLVAVGYYAPAAGL